MQKSLARYFREDLRSSRAAAHLDAESFDSVLFAIEQLGHHLSKGEATGLGEYRKYLMKLARRSRFYIQNGLDGVPFSRLYDLVIRARNDAFHAGAYARHLVENASSLALILEDALREEGDLNQAQDLMVAGPVCAEGWQSVQMVRRNMLLNSFSFLPILHEGEWKLVSDLSIARFVLRGARKDQVRVPLEKAVAEGQIYLTDPVRVEPHEQVDVLAAKLKFGVPALVVQRKRLLGIITPFDLL